MIGLNDKGWMIEMIHEAGRASALEPAKASSESEYDAYFGLGHAIRLIDKPGVFKVSPAGLALGSHLVTRVVADEDYAGRFLDLGTGSGVLAILLRSLGATDIVATDICGDAVDLAAENESLNFTRQAIAFQRGDLFEALKPGQDRFDKIVFNPPGWRTPSSRFLEEVSRLGGHADMALSSMFYGDDVLIRFLQELPDRLHPRGHAIVGMNSLVGIQDVLARYRNMHAGSSSLSFRLIERHTFPLLFYTDQWRRAETVLLEEFAMSRSRGAAAYVIDSRGRLYWSYELIECRINKSYKH